MAELKTGECSYCGKEISLSGLKNHERACARKMGQDLVDIEEVNQPEVEELTDTILESNDAGMDELEVITQDKPKVKLVEVKLSQNICCYIAGTRYNLHKGEVYQVPENVKQILMEADLLLAM